MAQKLWKIKRIVEQKMAGVGTAHDFSHVMRVYNLALHLAKDDPNVDLSVLKTAVLLHDIARAKEDQDDSGNTDHAILGAEMTQKVLEDLNYPKEKIKAVKHCIISHRFRSREKPQTIEAKILFDADKLDMIGATGIARSFIIAGENKQKIYSDALLNKYAKKNLIGAKLEGRIKIISQHSPNLEFATKMKYIPDKLYIAKAKKIARRRIKFMKQFFAQFKKEINGKA